MFWFFFYLKEAKKLCEESSIESFPFKAVEEFQPVCCTGLNFVFLQSKNPLVFSGFHIFSPSFVKCASEVKWVVLTEHFSKHSHSGPKKGIFNKHNQEYVGMLIF